MEIKKEMKDGILYVALTDKLDTLTSHTLLENLKDDIETAHKVVFDFIDLNYISSAGLRVLLTYQKKLGGKECVVINNSNDVIKNIFEVTGFINLLEVK